ncbi:hypothetical protein [Janthinobacterium sp.]|uniref:hypothetical protein n=1 Tax=Janthinobacterium sp. TaxID=1871054 RepID=UPI0025C3FC33|nr:hypothetical protein [Janthinobacterium sp.]NBV20306.1 hypothetical protein [Janthinobacterium sp.]
MRNYLEAHQGSSASEIAAALGVPVQSIGRALRVDCDNGHIDCDVVAGVYRYWIQSRPERRGTSRALFCAVELALKGGRVMTANELAKAIGRKSSITYTTLINMERHGFVVCESHLRPFRYRWTLRDGPQE